MEKEFIYCMRDYEKNTGFKQLRVHDTQTFSDNL